MDTGEAVTWPWTRRRRRKRRDAGPLLKKLSTLDKLGVAPGRFAIDPNPRDGEKVLSARIVGDCLVVEKETKVYTFYGTSTEPDGSPIYNYFVKFKN